MAKAMIKSEVLDELLAGRDPKTVFEQAAGNHCNGATPKTLLTETGKRELAIHRDRQGRFEPQLIAKYQRRSPGFNQEVMAW